MRLMFNFTLERLKCRSGYGGGDGFLYHLLISKGQCNKKEYPGPFLLKLWTVSRYNFKVDILVSPRCIIQEVPRTGDGKIKQGIDSLLI